MTDPARLFSAVAAAGLAAALLLAVLSAPSLAVPFSETGAPPELEPWANWVLYDSKEYGCPPWREQRSPDHCVLPVTLSLDLTDRGGAFRGTWEVRGGRRAVRLPGDSRAWPREVKDSSGLFGQSVPVGSLGEAPLADLEEGVHELTGEWDWTQLPETVTVPLGPFPAITVNGRPLEFPVSDVDWQAGTSRIWLRDPQSPPPASAGGEAGPEGPQPSGEDNFLEVRVARLVQDGEPPTVLTQARITVSGESREELVAGLLLPGSRPVSLESPLPSRLTAEGLRIQARPGTWTVLILARMREAPPAAGEPSAGPGAAAEEGSAAPHEAAGDSPADAAGGAAAEAASETSEKAAKGTPAKAADEAPAGGMLPPLRLGPVSGSFGQEYWAFAADPALRQAEVTGALQVDASQADIPWKDFPVYALDAGDILTITTVRRGDPDPGPNLLQLDRTCWLDYSGEGLTCRDSLTGQMRRDWRLTVDPPFELGEATMNGEPQVITWQKNSLGEDAPGIQTRRGQVALGADLRIPRFKGELPASGWDQGLQTRVQTVNLPPGWKLLHVSGADAKDPGGGPAAWRDRWTTLDLFIVLVTVFVAWRVLGLPWALLGAAALILTYQEHMSPKLVYLHLLAAAALLRALPPSGKARFLVSSWKVLAGVFLAVLCAAFVILQARWAAYPQLETPSYLSSAPWTPGRGTGFTFGGAAQMPDIYGYKADEIVMYDADSSQESYEPEPVASVQEAAQAPAPSRPSQRPPQERKQGAMQAPVLRSARQRSYAQSNSMQNLVSDAKAQNTFPRPSWNWRPVRLDYNGQAARDQMTSLTLTGPVTNRILGALRILLTVWFSLAVLGLRLPAGAPPFLGRLFPPHRRPKALSPETSGPPSAGGGSQGSGDPPDSGSPPDSGAPPDSGSAPSPGEPSGSGSGPSPGDSSGSGSASGAGVPHDSGPAPDSGPPPAPGTPPDKLSAASEADRAEALLRGLRQDRAPAKGRGGTSRETLGPPLIAGAAALAALLFLAAVAFFPKPLMAQFSDPFPPQELLQELESRLKSPSDSPPPSIPELEILPEPGRLTLTLTVDAPQETFLPLPDLDTQLFQAIRASVNSQDARLLVKDDLQLVLVPKGASRVTLEGRLKPADTFQITFNTDPRPLKARLAAPGWEFKGVDPQGHLQHASLIISRSQGGASATATPAPGPQTVRPCPEGQASQDSQAGQGDQDGQAGQGGQDSQECQEAQDGQDPDAEPPSGDVALPAGGAPSVLKPFFQVTRTISLGLRLQVITQVQQDPQGSLTAPFTLALPLAPGETPTSSAVSARDGTAYLALSPANPELSWESALTLGEDGILELTAGDGPYSEIWVLDASSLWRVETDGLPPVTVVSSSGYWNPEWRPAPGEKLRFRVTRPKPVEGGYLVADKAALSLQAGRESSRVTLWLDLRSSQGGNYSFRLPPGAEPEELKVDGRPVPFPGGTETADQGPELTVPLNPGGRSIEAAFTLKKPITAVTEIPPLDLGVPTANVTMTVYTPPDRWTLLAGGPVQGPAVLFWSYCGAFLVFSILLSSLRLTPLKTVSWFLFFLGLSQLSAAMAAFVAGWLLALGLRAGKLSGVKKPLLFNCLQILLLLWTGAALYLIYQGLTYGLLASPNMSVTGNGSSDHTLIWFQDRTAGELPQPWTLTLPGTVYRALMLAWALWLAVNVVRWLRWGWKGFSREGLWKRSPKKPGPPKLTPAQRLAMSRGGGGAPPGPGAPPMAFGPSGPFGPPWSPPEGWPGYGAPQQEGPGYGDLQQEGPSQGGPSPGSPGPGTPPENGPPEGSSGGGSPPEGPDKP
ncbi:MAG: hypothetical protein LBW85_09500 [Deltaproteobacteria bacterium]|jgi:hypothetical protein|nr:hypothetical protein [Deltaproteobacteria bacterium]